MANKPTVEDIRVFMRDRLARNDLLERFEFTDEEIEKAMLFAVDSYNLKPPIQIIATIGNFPYRPLLMLGTAATLLLGESMAQLRNELDYSDGGIHVGVDNKWQKYLQFAQTLQQQFDQIASEIKMQINADAAFGGTASPYIGLPIL